MIDATMMNPEQKEAENKLKEMQVRNKDSMDIIGTSLQVKNSIESLNLEMANMMRSKSDLIAGISMEEEIIKELIADKTSEDLKNMSDDEYVAILETIEFDPSGILSEDNKSPNHKVLRELLLYFKVMDEQLAEMDAMNAKFAKEMQESQEELQSLMDSFESPIEFTRITIKNNIEKATELEDEGLIKKYKEIENSFNQAFSFSEYREKLSTLNLRNIIKDYNDNDRSVVIFEKYTKLINFLNIKTDITNLDRFEEVILPEKYHKYPNLFLYSIIRFYSYIKPINASKHIEGTFLNQLYINLSSVMLSDKISEEDRNTIINGIMSVLDLFDEYYN